MQPTRRSYSKSFRAQVIQECAQPGASIASIALSHNLVHKWIRPQSQKSTALQPAFIPLAISPPGFQRLQGSLIHSTTGKASRANRIYTEAKVSSTQAS
ncbi:MULTISPECIES: transposase [Pseudomonas]|uniref:transposase n=1 Tax=Pseudomonas TaxID=286 RepID=UPI0038B66B09